MDSIHDMGGMDGFGRVQPENNEPVFHHTWEGRALGLNLATGALRKWTLDRGRHSSERLTPHEYLTLSYYERWVTCLADRCVEFGLLTLDEIKQGKPAAGSVKQTPPLPAVAVSQMLATGRSSVRPINEPPKFKIGDRVRTKTDSPKGHTRLARYARGREGVIEAHHGGHVFADSSALMTGEHPQHLYTVRFTARELWGEQSHPRDSVTLELFESYLKDD
jgi:nitrile hydratase beta subunit